MNDDLKNNKQNKYKLADRIMYLLIGGGIGSALALLFAPKRGSEMRHDIADVTRKGYDATLEITSDLKQQSADIIHSAKEKVESVYEMAPNKLAHGAEVTESVVSAPTAAVADGIDRMQNESAMNAEQAGNGRRGSYIF